MDLWFPLLAHERGLSATNNSPPYFDITNLIRFKNTLTKKIYYQIGSEQHFHLNVFGTDTDVHGVTLSDSYWGEVLNWISLYSFDNDSPSIYTILKDHAEAVITNDLPSTFPGYGSNDYSKFGGIPGQSYLGLSEVIKAQWDRECVDLTLYNRHQVYDQDFFAKNDLTIAPKANDAFHQSGIGQASFADPVITTDEFIFESGITSNVYTGQAIHLMPGVKFNHGTHVNLFTQPTTCASYHQMQTSSGIQYISDTQKHQDGDQALLRSSEPESKVWQVQVYPNPSSSGFTLAHNGNAPVQVRLMDALGKTVLSRTVVESNYAFGETLPPGVYHLLVTTHDQSQSLRIIKQ